jgi:translation initiation factor IF-2
MRYVRKKDRKLAKNLKITVKNVQLAEALKKIKKPEKKPSIHKVVNNKVADSKSSESSVKKEAFSQPSTNPPTSKEAPTSAKGSVYSSLDSLPEQKKETSSVNFVEKEKEKAESSKDLFNKNFSSQGQTSVSRSPRQRFPYDKPSTSQAGFSPSSGFDRRPYSPSSGGGGEYRRPYSPSSGGGGEYRRPYSPSSGGGGEYRRPYSPSSGGGGGEYRRPYSPSSGGGGGEYRKPYSSTRPQSRPFAPGSDRPPSWSGERPARPPFVRPPGSSGGGFKPGGFPRAAPSGNFKSDGKVSSRASPRSKEGADKDSKDLKVNKRLEEYKAFDSRDKQGLRSIDDEGWRPRKGRKQRGSFSGEELIDRPKNLSIRLPITVKDLAVEMKLKASQILSNLFMKGVVITLNDFLDDETPVQLLGSDFDCEIVIDTTEEKRIQITDKTIKQEIQETPSDQLIFRAPVVTFMGHVDHGKTSLIDVIRKSNIVSEEAGAITQHIGAFKCHTVSGDITILDTPGHEAFSAMRCRGAEVTDIVVLVVAGDEGLKTQTLEAINQARAAQVTMVVAINKSDKQNFNADNVYRQLSEVDLLPEAWGGKTITVACSASTGAGVKELLEMLALQAEVLELKANPSARARGAVIESEMHKGLGAVTTVLVQNGTLRIGDAIVFAQHWGKVKTMHDEYDQLLTEAGPSTPVKITGLSGLPEAGSDFIVVIDEKEASSVSKERLRQKKHVALQVKRGSLENLLQQTMDKQEKKSLSLILRADVQGSLEALKHSLEKIESSKIDINVVSSAVGEITESDVSLAAALKATIIGFHTKIESHAEPLIKQLKVKISLHDIIYHAVDDIKKLMIAQLDKVPQEHECGSVEVRAVFKSSQVVGGNIAGCQVLNGIIKRSSHVRVVRGKEIIWKGSIESLKRGKEDVREVSKGQDCGILLQGFTNYQEGDVFQGYDITYLTPEL